MTMNGGIELRTAGARGSPFTAAAELSLILAIRSPSASRGIFVLNAAMLSPH
jgi:hypothetical protein